MHVVMHKHFKRIATDAAGYFLILLGIAFGWLPGPGGIPLVVAGLGLLSINNKWAQDLRDYVLKNGSKLVKVLFPNNKFVEFLYDLLVAVLFVLVGFLAWQHAAIWQISLAIALFFIALFIALMNRDRLNRLKTRRQKRKN
jgi:hypothetical protein